MESDNFSNTKGAGQGVIEHKLDFEPGYRIYLGRDGEQLVILLGGCAKKRQNRDIEFAQTLWKDYKRLCARVAGQADAATHRRGAPVVVSPALAGLVYGLFCLDALSGAYAG